MLATRKVTDGIDLFAIESIVCAGSRSKSIVVVFKAF